MIDIGVDESQSGSLLVVSAIVGKTADMRKLDREWKGELAAKGVGYFHAKDHWNAHARAYHNVCNDDREKLLSDLVIHLQRRFLFGASVVGDKNEHLSASTERFRSQQGSAYAWGFQMLMTLVLTELVKQDRNNQPVNVLIEDGHANVEQVIGLIKRKKELNAAKGLRIESYGLGGKKDNPILQAADMLAFGVCEFRVKGSSDFAARLGSGRHAKPLLEYRSDRETLEAARFDLDRHASLKRSGAPGSKHRTELVMW